MALEVLHPGPSGAGRTSVRTVDGARWTCALVNNMPDGAFQETEQQFLGLVEAGAGCRTVEVRRYALPGVPRAERTAARIAEHYLPMETLADQPPDLLIVSGANPIETTLEDEPYWSELVELLRWGSEEVGSMLLSCLSAHAALSVFDGIERQRLDTKCTGVFAQQVDRSHPLASGLEAPVLLPHSRINAVPTEAIRSAGYRVALGSDQVGWSVATRTVGRADVVLVQGHPEYSPSSLLREYHRDARRFVTGERDEFPCLPLHCVADEDWPQLEGLHRQITGARREPALVESFPFDDLGARATWPWRPVAATLYANWLDGVPNRSE